MHNFFLHLFLIKGNDIMKAQRLLIPEALVFLWLYLKGCYCSLEEGNQVCVVSEKCWYISFKVVVKIKHADSMLLTLFASTTIFCII